MASPRPVDLEGQTEADLAYWLVAGERKREFVAAFAAMAPTSPNPVFQGVPALLRASVTGNLGIIATLLASGADVETGAQLNVEMETYPYFRQGERPLAAAGRTHGLDTTRLLLAAGADPFAVDASGATAIERLAEPPGLSGESCMGSDRAEIMLALAEAMRSDPRSGPILRAVHANLPFHGPQVIARLGLIEPLDEIATFWEQRLAIADSAAPAPKSRRSRAI